MPLMWERVHPVTGCLTRPQTYKRTHYTAFLSSIQSCVLASGLVYLDPGIFGICQLCIRHSVTCIIHVWQTIGGHNTDLCGALNF